MAHATAGHLAGVQASVEQGLPLDVAAEALTHAVDAGQVACVAALLPACDHVAHRNAMSKAACRSYHGPDVLALLMTLPFSQAEFTEALVNAAYHGQEEAAHMLLPRSDPRLNGSEALEVAIQGGWCSPAFIATLAAHSDVADVWTRLVLHRLWAGLDHVAPFVPAAMLESAIKTAPADRIPKTRMLWAVHEAAMALEACVPAGHAPPSGRCRL